MSERFIFSTRYLGDTYAFNERKPLKPGGPIDRYIESHLWRKEDAYNLYSNNLEEIRQYCVDNSIQGFEDWLGEFDIMSNFDDKKGAYSYLIPFFQSQRTRGNG